MGSLQLIASTNTNSGSTTATISFTNISQSYTDLILFASIHTNGSGSTTNMPLTLNTGNNYSQQFSEGSGSSVFAATQTGQDGIYFMIPGSFTESQTYSNSFFYIQHYKSSNVKIAIAQSGASSILNPGARSQNELTGRQSGTLSAITRIDFVPQATFYQYCSFYLYGIDWTP